MVSRPRSSKALQILQGYYSNLYSSTHVNGKPSAIRPSFRGRLTTLKSKSNLKFVKFVHACKTSSAYL